MKISFLIPTKDGGEGFAELFKSVKSNIDYAHTQGHNFNYDAVLIINGDPQKPLKYFKLNKNIGEFIKIKQVNVLGKIASINYYLKHDTSDIVVILDDDVSFGKDLLSLALNDLNSNQQLKLISFQTRALPYPGRNILSRFFYDVINIRSLKKLYKRVDPFLFGRFLVVRRDVIEVPNHVINEDLYLSFIHDKHYLIRPEEVFYIGEHSIWSHIKRVLRIEAGRNQMKEMFGSVYEKISNKNKREIDFLRLKNLSSYNKVCYYCYCLLRFFTNSVVAKLFRHKTSHW